MRFFPIHLDLSAMLMSTTSVLICTTLVGCASTSLGDRPRQFAALETSCPTGTVRQCETWGGNRFKKRYTNCYCNQH
jgi:hypothetical protein